MKLKQRPEDFQVTESWRFEEDPRGAHFVYLMDKQKLSTFEAVDRICARFKIPRAAVSFCGLKDKQGRTTQLDRGGAAPGRAAGAGPAAQAPGTDRPPALGREHHLEPLRGDGPRPGRRTTWPASPPRSPRSAGWAS